MNPYFKLMRLDKPIGIWLLFFPAAWAVGIAAVDFGDIILLEVLVLLGAFVTRSAGCIINDLTDQELDRSVERTKNRPLASGEVSRRDAIILLAMLLFTALVIAALLPTPVLVLALIAVPMITAYPWMKRFTDWPQMFLGLTFNLSALMGWAATNNSLTPSAFILYLTAVIWTLAYDTIYAVQDMEDDAKIGILSSARTLGITRLNQFITYCYGAVIMGFILIGFLSQLGICYYLGLIACAAHARWQISHLPCPPAIAATLFKSNGWFGLYMLLGILFSRLIG